MGYKVDNFIIPAYGDPNDEFEPGQAEVIVNGSSASDLITLKQNDQKIILHIEQVAQLIPVLKYTQ